MSKQTNSADTSAQPFDPNSLSDADIEHFALKHIATLFGRIGPGGDYKKTEQFKRIKAYTLDILAKATK